MCGILGSLNIPFDNTILDLISHRGPDDAGNEEVVVNGHSVHFGHRRLSIVDLSPAGHQPMFDDSQNFIMILNGEIYNHQELRDKLPPGIKFRGHSDTETILYCLKEYGMKALGDFNGIFALAFLDIRAKKLFLARDPFGVKPLYYSGGEDNSFIFSSEIRPVTALSQETDLNTGSLASLLRLRYNPSPDTLYNSVRKVRPGHYLVVDLTGKSVSYNEYSYLKEIPVTISNRGDDITGTYGKKLEEAVKRQLMSDVEVGILLSGGIDSALVAALAVRNYNGKMKAYTVGFEGDFNEDEVQEAEETARFLGLEHKYRKISFVDFIDIIKKCTQIVEEPLATTSIIPMYFLSELASRDVKVVLTGQGADEPLGGYTRYKLELLRNMIPPVIRNIPVSSVFTKRISNENISKGLDSLSVKDDIDRFLTIWEVFSREEIKQLIQGNDTLSSGRIQYFYDLLNCGKKNNSAERIMALDARLNLADDLLIYTDKITMNFALECRVPMLDIELVRFIESLPSDLKINLREGKRIHRDYARRILPENLINRTKKGFLSPTNNWFRDQHAVIRELLLSPGTRFSEIFKQSSVSEIIRKHQKGFNQEKKIFLLLSIYFWLENLSGTTSKPKLIASAINSTIK